MYRDLIKIMYRRNGGEWNNKVPDKLEYGNYELQYFVKDSEGVWSDPFVMNFSLNAAPTIQFKASLKTLEKRFSISSIPASEFFNVYDL